MPTSFVKAESLLAIDVGMVHTRAALFDVVEARYRYLGSGVANTTLNAPYNDIREGVRQAIDHLQLITGRQLVDAEEVLITPERVDGSGIDTVAVTISAGKPLKIIAIGLLEDVSLESALNLAGSTFARVEARMSLNDRLRTEDRINLILRTQPNLMIVAGGTEGGASQPVLKILEAIGLSTVLTSEDNHPEILYTGNQELQDEIKKTIGLVATLNFSPNVRPTLDEEQIDSAQTQLSSVYKRIQKRRIPGMVELDDWANGSLIPTYQGWGRVIGSMNKIYGLDKGVLAVDVGASATIITAANKGSLIQGVYSDFGMAADPESNPDGTFLKQVLQWLKRESSLEAVSDYLYTKAAYPTSLPSTEEELDLEQALARLCIRASLERINPQFKALSHRGESLGMPDFEPIVASGSVLTRAPRLSQAALVLLDGIQPVHVTTLILDQHHLLPSIGAAAGINPMLAAQAMDYGTLLNIGTVISPVGIARPGTPVMKVKIQFDNGRERSVEIPFGSLSMFPLPIGQTAQIHLQTLHGFDVGMGGAGRGGRVRVTGGALGIIIDARGRPVRLSNDPEKRREAMRRWLAALENPL